MISLLQRALILTASCIASGRVTALKLLGLFIWAGKIFLDISADLQSVHWIKVKDNFETEGHDRLANLDLPLLITLFGSSLLTKN